MSHPNPSRSFLRLPALLLAVALTLPSAALAWFHNCNGPSGWAAVQGNVTFAGAGAGWSFNGTNLLIARSQYTGHHSQVQGPRPGPAYSTDFSNAWTFKVKFVGGNNADKLNQIFFQVFEQVTVNGESYYEPVLMAIRRPNGQVFLRAVHQGNYPGTNIDYPQDDEEFVIGTAAFDQWLHIKVAARFTTNASTGWLRGVIVPTTQNLDAAHNAAPTHATNLLFRGAQANKTTTFFGNYAFPVNYSGSFVGTVNIDEVWQQFASWGF